MTDRHEPSAEALAAARNIVLYGPQTIALFEENDRRVALALDAFRGRPRAPVREEVVAAVKSAIAIAAKRFSDEKPVGPTFHEWLARAAADAMPRVAINENAVEIVRDAIEKAEGKPRGTVGYDAVARAAIAAMPSPPPQPIATAKRDGRTIVLMRFGWVDENGDAWIDNPEGSPALTRGLWWITKGFWSDTEQRWVIRGWDKAEFNEPSHWVDMPEEPA